MTENIISDNGSPNNAHDDSSSEKDKYFEALRSWLHQAQIYQQFCACFPYYLMACQMPLPFQANGNPSFLNNNYQNHGAWPYNPLSNNNEDVRVQNVRVDLTNQQSRNDLEILNRHGGYEYVIPPLWKRFLAEQLDFFILVFIKLAVTYAAVEYFDFIDLEKYDVDTIAKKIQGDYTAALEITSEILVLELVYRFVVCIFEAIFLCINIGGRPGGATPGKAIFGLRVVSATTIVPLANRSKETVLIYPGTGISFMTSLVRAAVKNAFITLLFPVFTLTFFFQHNRTAYDTLCNVLVVENGGSRPRRIRP